MQARIFFKDTKTPKYFSVMATFYKIVHVLCCLDFGFYEHKSKIYRIVHKLLTALQAILISSVYIYLTFYYNLTDGFLWYIFFLIHYLLNIAILLAFTPKATFCQLHKDLHHIDIKLGVKDDYFNFETKIVLINVIVILYYVIAISVSCSDNIESFSNCPNPFFMSLVVMMIVSSCFVYISCTLLFYLIYCRIKCFASILRKEKRMNVHAMKLIYKSIADLTEMYKSAFGALILTTLLFTTIEMMAQVIYLLQQIKYVNTVTFKTTTPRLLIHLVSIFAPAIFAEKTATTTKYIKLILHDKLITEEDSTRQLELERFIRYVEARPLRFRLYRVIPLDASLFGMVLNFIVTYLIVIIQFMYK